MNEWTLSLFKPFQKKYIYFSFKLTLKVNLWIAEWMWGGGKNTQRKILPKKIFSVTNNTLWRHNTWLTKNGHTYTHSNDFLIQVCRECVFYVNYVPFIFQWKFHWEMYVYHVHQKWYCRIIIINYHEIRDFSGIIGCLQDQIRDHETLIRRDAWLDGRRDESKQPVYKV